MGQEDAVYLAKLAEQAERYEGMICYASHLQLQGERNPVPRRQMTDAHSRDGREHEDCCFGRC